jgi:hypothetical protein
MHLTSFEPGKTMFKPRNTRNTRKETGFRVFRVFRGKIKMTLTCEVHIPVIICRMLSLPNALRTETVRVPAKLSRSPILTADAAQTRRLKISLKTQASRIG